MSELPVVKGLLGWREMTLLPGGILTSPQQECGFPDRVAPLATCNMQRPMIGMTEHERIPGSKCTCGYYAVYKKEHATGYQGNCVVKISALGETEMHELGFRCAQFRIDEVYVQDESLAEALRERLGIDIFIEEAPCKSESESSASQQSLTQMKRETERLILEEVLKRTQQQFQPLIQSPLGVSQPGGPLPTDFPPPRMSASDHTHPTPSLTAGDVLQAKKKLEDFRPKYVN